MDLRLGFAMSGSFCTFSRVMEEVKKLVEGGADVTPILSYNAANTDTRFGAAADWKAQLTALTGRAPLETLVEVEPIGPKGLFDVLVVAPCTGTMPEAACSWASATASRYSPSWGFCRIPA